MLTLKLCKTKVKKRMWLYANISAQHAQKYRGEETHAPVSSEFFQILAKVKEKK